MAALYHRILTSSAIRRETTTTAFVGLCHFCTSTSGKGPFSFGSSRSFSKKKVNNNKNNADSCYDDTDNKFNNSNSTKSVYPMTATTMIESTTSSTLQVKLLNDNATMPKRGSPLSAGFDLAASEPNVVPPGGRAVIKTGLSVACPLGTYARIAPRSGLAVKKMIDVGAGVVDADYRGEVGVVIFNFGKEPFEVNVGDRIAQLILEQVCMVDAVEVDDLTDTVRGEGGFGSTGVAKNQDEQVEKKLRKD